MRGLQVVPPDPVAILVVEVVVATPKSQADARPITQMPRAVKQHSGEFVARLK